VKTLLLTAAFVLSSTAAMAALSPEKVVAQAKADFGANCDGEYLPEISAKDRVQTVTLKEEFAEITYHAVLCNMAAYNSDGVIYYETIVGDGIEPKLMQIHLTEPVLGPRNGIKGYKAMATAPGAGIDEKGMLTTFMKARGIGDAFTSATYKLEAGEATLVKYVVDNTLDGRINPKTIINIKK
jgi:hypothetical protein